MRGDGPGGRLQQGADDPSAQPGRVRALVQQLFGETALKCRRSPGRGARATFLVDTPRRRLVVRLSSLPPAASHREAAVLEACRAQGLPVPRVLHIGAAGTGLHAVVLERLPGEPLEPARFPEPGGSADPVAAAGGLLARLHRIEVRGFGPLVGPLQGAFPDWAPVIDLWLRVVDGASGEPFRSLGVATREVEGRMERLAGWTRPAAARLLHGDFKLEHVLVQDGAISGLIDLECALSGDPLWDLARWSTFEPAPEVWDRFLGGYGSGLPGDLGVRLALYRIRQSVEIGLHALSRGDRRRLAQVKRNLERDLRRTA